MSRFNWVHACVRIARVTVASLGIVILVIEGARLLVPAARWMLHQGLTHILPAMVGLVPDPQILWNPFQPKGPLTNASVTRDWLTAIGAIVLAGVMIFVLARLISMLYTYRNPARLVIERFTDGARPSMDQAKDQGRTESDANAQLHAMSLQAREVVVETMRGVRHILECHRAEHGGPGKYCDPLPGGSTDVMTYALGTYAGAVTDVPLPEKEAQWLNPLIRLLSQPRCTRVLGTVYPCRPGAAEEVTGITFEVVDVTTPDEPEVFSIKRKSNEWTDGRSDAQSLLRMAAVSLALELLRRDMLQHPRKPIVWERRYGAQVYNFIATLYGRLANASQGFYYKEQSIKHLLKAIDLNGSDYRAHANLADRYSIDGQWIFWHQHDQPVEKSVSNASEWQRRAVVEYNKAFEHTRMLRMRTRINLALWFMFGLRASRRSTDLLVLLMAARARAELLTEDADIIKLACDKHIPELEQYVKDMGDYECIRDYRTLYFLACLYAVKAQDDTDEGLDVARKLLAYSLVRNSRGVENREVVTVLGDNDSGDNTSHDKPVTSDDIEDPDWYYWKCALEDEDLTTLNYTWVKQLERSLLAKLRSTPGLRTTRGPVFKQALSDILQNVQGRASQN